METQELTTSKYGKRYSQAEKDEILERCRAGRLKLDAFARQAGIAPTTVKRWLGMGKTIGGPKMVAVRLKAVALEAKERFEVEFSCGTTLRIGQAGLATVVNVLRRPC